MSNTGWRNIVILVGVVCTAVFLALSVDSLNQVNARTPKITPKVAAGKQVWQAKDCIGCHTILGNGSYYAPDLTKVYSQRGEAWLLKFLQNPGQVMPGTSMRNIRLTESEAQALVSFLQWVDGVDTNGWPPEPLTVRSTTMGQAGLALLNRKGCIACHAVNGQGGTAGPDLAGLGSRRSPDSIKMKLQDPTSDNPKSNMPKFVGNDSELTRLVEYLSTLK